VAVKQVVVAGGGIGGLAAAALLGRAGHHVTLLEAASYLGGKSRRIQLDGQVVDIGPSLVTFPRVWEVFLRRWDGLGDEGSAEPVARLKLVRLPEVGRYYYRENVAPLPLSGDHPWRPAWERFAKIHGALGPEITHLLTTDPLDRRTLPVLRRLLSVYGTKLTTKSYLESLRWLPDGLREVIAIHTLNAGVGPARTPALFASMPAVMAGEGVWVPEGGIYEMVLALARLAAESGVEVRTESPVVGITRGRVLTEEREYAADVVVSDLDAERLRGLLEPEKKLRPARLSCSGVALYAALREELPPETPAHSVVLPADADSLYRSLEVKEEPSETMVFVNYYRPGEIYHTNDRGVLALLLTAPANGRDYDLEDAFVARELERVSRLLELRRPIPEYFGSHAVLHPRYFGEWGGAGGALYGAVRPLWRSGPLHRPPYSDRKRPWLYRVGASVHPGGGIPAVLGGALISTGRLLKALGSR
jgi:phytoene dehydrogenase-like protein